jgi:hypothetical protein
LTLPNGNKLVNADPLLEKIRVAARLRLASLPSLFTGTGVGQFRCEA